MKIRLLSDLHLEHMKDAGKAFLGSLQPLPDTVLVLAGDITSMKSVDYALPQLKALSAIHKHVFFVNGNHSFYGSNPTQVLENTQEIASLIPNFTVLTSDNPVEYEGQRFLGDVLWFPYHPSNRHYERELNDFHLIKDFKPWVYEQHEGMVKNFTKHLKEGDILVTHHLPHPQGIHPIYALDSLNRFFLGDISNLIEERKPTLVFFGHTHSPISFEAKPTKFFCNPKGYPSNKNNGFNPNLV